jgi:hypothetical protein
MSEDTNKENTNQELTEQSLDRVAGGWSFPATNPGIVKTPTKQAPDTASARDKMHLEDISLG